jgi:hypothetical protein
MQRVHKNLQQGAALILSLLFLLILTIIGLSALSNSGLEARMGHNYQLVNTVFHAAETTIDTVLFRGDKGSFTNPNPTYDVNNDKLEEALAGGVGGISNLNLTDAELDPDGFLVKASMTSASTITYVRLNEFCRGGGSCFEFDIEASANIPDTSARTTHTQGISITAPEL